MRFWNLLALIGLVLVAIGAALPFFIGGPWAGLIFPVGVSLCWIVNKAGPAEFDSPETHDGPDFATAAF